jgi:hypothetical protein
MKNFSEEFAEKLETRILLSISSYNLGVTVDGISRSMAEQTKVPCSG